MPLAILYLIVKRVCLLSEPFSPKIENSRLHIVIFAAMIAFLTGSFAHKTPSYVHIDVHGVGYEVQISLNTYSAIQDK